MEAAEQGLRAAQAAAYALAVARVCQMTGTRNIGWSNPYDDRQPETEPCTGLTAPWCPVHGDCICRRGPVDGDFEAMNAPGCALYSPSSTHPLPRPGRPPLVDPATCQHEADEDAPVNVMRCKHCGETAA